MKYLKIFAFSLVLGLSFTATSCSDDDDPKQQEETLKAITDIDASTVKVGTKTSSPDGTYTLSNGNQVTVVSGVVVALKTAAEIAEEEQAAAYLKVCQNFVTTTATATYKGLADACEKLIDAIDAIADGGDTEVEAACDLWKESRQYWEWSESHLFGAASTLGIDPHIDTWPFDRTQFDQFMLTYPNLATDETSQGIVEQAITTGQNLTGFHAVEYLLFRNGNARKRADITANELWFMQTAANDLYLSAVRLEASWTTGNISAARQALLDEAEAETTQIGYSMYNAGQKGSGYTTELLGAIQIIEGCEDIIDEVAHSKIGAAYTGEDVTYIESPHAYNSITDFYDNIMGCKDALYGFGPSTENYEKTTAAENSLMAYCLSNDDLKSAAANVMTKMENALKAINNMKRPFVLYYTDATAGTAIDALDELTDALGTLKDAMNK